ncbi:MAG: transcriptional repressor [Clostridium sp.]|nr:transcriptional repressor [Clostridium sp.]
MKEEDRITQRLEQRDVKPTALRLLIYRTLEQSNQALSLIELEERLETVDRSTIFRTLTVFLSHHLVHGIEDGSGSVRYEICQGDCACTVEDMHAHFYCEQCHRTFCFRQTGIPAISLPDGFVMQGVNYVVKGLCPDCARKQ